MNPRYPEVAARAAHRCEYCQAPEAIFNVPFEVEHIIPPLAGGSDQLSNLALACRGCNLFKADRIEGLDPDGGQLVRLFNPRTDQWNEHFRLELATESLIGLTSQGRATIHQLRMNRPVQIAARRAWMRLGIYPPE